jgi:hypothetical protein
MPEVALLLSLRAPGRHLARANSKGSAGSGTQNWTKADKNGHIFMRIHGQPDNSRHIFENIITPPICRTGQKRTKTDTFLRISVANRTNPDKSGHILRILAWSTNAGLTWRSSGPGSHDSAVGANMAPTPIGIPRRLDRGRRCCTTVEPGIRRAGSSTRVPALLENLRISNN